MFLNPAILFIKIIVVQAQYGTVHRAIAVETARIRLYTVAIKEQWCHVRD